MLAARGAQNRRPVPRARGQRRVRHRGAHRDDVRGDARRHRLQRRRLPPAAWAVLRRSRASPRTGTSTGYPSGQAARAARHGGRAQQSFGLAPHGAVLPRAPSARARTSLGAPKRAARRRTTPAKCLPARVIELMQATANAEWPCRARLRRHASSTRSPTGAEPQYRVIKNAPMDVGATNCARCSARRCATGSARSSSRGGVTAGLQPSSKWRSACAPFAHRPDGGTRPRRQSHGERAALARLAVDRRARPGAAAARA